MKYTYAVLASNNKQQLIANTVKQSCSAFDSVLDAAQQFEHAFSNRHISNDGAQAKLGQPLQNLKR